MGLKTYQNHYEIYLRYLILKLYTEYGTIILVITETPRKPQGRNVGPPRPGLGSSCETWSHAGPDRPGSGSRRM